MCRFPGRAVFEWTLLLPLAVPTYAIAFTYGGLFEFAGPVQTALRDEFGWGRGDYWFPEVRSLGGAVLVMSVVLYPYVYLLARAAFLEQSVCVIEVSRTLGRGPWRSFMEVALPLARPAIAGGVALALMEALSDFGAVQYLAVATFTTGIFRTWFGLGELDGSLTPRLEEVKNIMENVATISMTQNIEGAKWTKLICNTMTMGPIGLTGLKNWDARKLPGMFDMSVALGRESMAVGKALGYELEPIFGLKAEDFSEASDEVLIKAMETLMAHVGKEGVTAAIHDHIKGRQSEMSLINGLVARAGKKFGIPVTCNAAVTEIDRRINDGEIAMDPSNFGLLKSMVESIPNRL